MIVVVGHLVVAPEQREAHLTLSAGSVRSARAAPGCRHFSVSADAVEPGWVDVAEVWDDRAALNAYRSSGPDEGAEDVDPFAHVLEFHVTEHEV